MKKYILLVLLGATISSIFGIYGRELGYSINQVKIGNNDIKKLDSKDLDGNTTMNNRHPIFSYIMKYDTPVLILLTVISYFYF